MSQQRPIQRPPQRRNAAEYSRGARLRAQRRKKQQQKMMIVGGAALLALILLIVIIVILVGRGGKKVDNAVVLDLTTPTPTVEVAEEALTAKIVETPAPTAVPTPTPAPITNTERVYINERSRYVVQSPEGWIPIMAGAETDEKIIAITVDDCFQPTNLRKIVQCALDNGGRLTIFPIGKNAIKENIAPVIKWAWESGMEIENHTFNHNGLFAATDEELAWEVCMQSNAIDYVLGVDYTEHFLRPRGGDARYDQRMHQYAQQFGMYGIAHWSNDGSKSSISKLKNGLKPGNLYLFHTTNNDLSLLLEFIPYATQQGYQLVTLNEMYGIPENETKPLTVNAVDQPVIPLQPFTWVPVTLKKGTFSYGVTRLQQYLIDNGYLSGNADGDYGDNTKNAVAKWQRDHGLESTGVADVQTQTQMGLFS